MYVSVTKALLNIVTGYKVLKQKLQATDKVHFFNFFNIFSSLYHPHVLIDKRSVGNTTEELKVLLKSGILNTLAFKLNRKDKTAGESERSRFQVIYVALL